MLSSSFTMPSPCTAVHFLIGDPPPILLYCSWIFGVRRFAINGANLLKHSKGTHINTITQITTLFPKSLHCSGFSVAISPNYSKPALHGLMLYSITLPKLTRWLETTICNKKRMILARLFPENYNITSCTEWSQDETVLRNADIHRSYTFKPTAKTATPNTGVQCFSLLSWKRH